jgi:hypothetical protein
MRMPMPAAEQAIRPVETVAEGTTLIVDLLTCMQKLLEVAEKESAVVRTGRIGIVTELAAIKGELTGAYLAGAERVKRSAKFLSANMPDQCAHLREFHEAFRKRLRVSLTVLATAHAVSEGIIRGVAEDVARRSAPQTYGKAGRPNVPRTRAAQPVALSRTL